MLIGVRKEKSSAQIQRVCETVHLIRCPDRQVERIEKSKAENWRLIQRRRKYNVALRGISAFRSQYRMHFRVPRCNKAEMRET